MIPETETLMSIEESRADHGAETAKKPYQKPQIEDYGTVVELTGTGSGTIEDGGGVFAFSGAAS